MNIIDPLIIIVVVLALMRGYTLGLVRQAGSTVGFILGLIAGSWVGNFIMGYENSTLSRSLTGLLATLFGGLLLLSVGETLGARAKQKLNRNHPLDSIDGTLGSVMGAITLLLGLWLMASILVLGPVGGLQQALKSSRILSTLDSRLPPATTIFSSLNQLINPNGFPEVFRGLEPNPNTTVNLPSLGSFGPIVQASEASVVKVEGTGCGGIVEGSGFIVAQGEIATNAHVVAGVANPKIIDQDGHIHNTRVVWFDPDVDLAVLRVSGLSGKPLTVDTVDASNNTPGVVLGFPGGGSFDAQPAAIIEHFTAVGRNIYGQGDTQRDVYSLKAHVIPGNSGGPVVGQNGQVLGIVFATSTSYNNVGYALTGHQVASELATAEHSNTTRSTGACSE